MAQRDYRDSDYDFKDKLKHKAVCNVDNDIGYHHLLNSTFEGTLLSSNLRKDGFNIAESNEKSRSDKVNKANLINDLTKDKKMVNEEIKTKKKKCKHKCDKDRSRKKSSNKEIKSTKRIGSHESYYKSKSDRSSYSNQNFNYNQEKMYRRGYNDDRYKSCYYYKRNGSYTYNYRYQGSISSKRRVKSRSRSERVNDLRFDQQKILEAAKSNLSKMIVQNELLHGFDAKREQFKHLNDVNDKKLIQDFTQICKTITEQESQSNSSFGEVEFNLNSDSDEIKSSNLSDRLQNSRKNGSVKKVNEWSGVQQYSAQFIETPDVPLSNSNKLAGRSAWARKDQLITTNKIQEGIGMHLLMKMGWKPGEGLGRDSNGLIEPIMPMLKFDTKGLVSEEEKKKKSFNKSKEKFDGPECKHPVSLLQELCAKRKISAPSYEVIQQTGPDHKKTFIMKVTVDEIEYQPLITSRSKKDAKALAATVCLEALRPTIESNQI